MRSGAWLKAAAVALVAGATMFACTVEEDDPAPPATGTGGTNEGGVGGGAGQAGQAGTGGASGEAGNAGTGGGGGSVTCTKITVKDIARDPDSDDTMAIVYGTTDPALGGADPDQWDLQLYEANGAQAPGTFDLGSGSDANFKTCDHCVLVLQDMGTQAVGKYFFQSAGELTMTVNGSPMTGKVKGSLKNAKLVEVTIGDDYTSTPVAGGACLEIDTLDFDTTVPVADAGTPCENATDCGDTDIMICDPATKGCQPGQCDAATKCAAGKSCFGQVESPTIGACYTDCQYPSTTCGSGYACDVGLAGTTGRCLAVGTGAADGPCAPAESSIGTRCVADYTCMVENLADGGTANTCRKMCDYWGTSACDSGTYCSAVGPVCTSSGENVAIGTACAKEYAACAPVGGRYEGICVETTGADGGTALTCEKWCRVGQAADCPNGQECDPGTFSGLDTIGVCKVPPVPGWSCAFSYYEDGYCDCDCTKWDKDCDDPTAQQYDCTAPEVCITAGNPGTCGTPGDAAAD